MKQHPFLNLIEQHSGAINHLCRSFSRGNEADCEDLRQEVMLNLWRGWKRYRPEHKSITWVYRVALNTCISWYRQARRKAETIPLEGVDFATDSLHSDEQHHLLELVALLPESDQRLVALYLDGWSTNEIGIMLNISQSNVTTRFHRIKDKLRNIEQQWR